MAGGGAAPELHFPFNAPGPETWTALLSRTQPRADHTAIGYPNGDVLLAGGTSMVASATTSVEMFHPTALTFPALRQPDTFETKAQLKVARAGHAAALVPDGRAVVFGGRDASGSVLGSIEAYDYSLDRWTLLPATLAVPRTNAHAILLGDGTVLVLGGRDASGNPVGLAEVFEPSSGTVSSSGTLGVPRVDEDVSFNGFVIVAGGTDAGGKPLSSIEVYDPVSRTFRAGGSLQVPRAGLALAFSVDTPDLIATGGNDSTGTRGDLEAIDLTTLLPAPVAGFTQLDTPRSFHRASGLDDTSVLLTGGEQGQLVLDASGLYFLIVPAPQGFNALNATVRPTIVPHMNRARTKHTATVLPDGRVLVVGGIDGRGVAIAGGEVFVAPAEVIFTSTPQVFSVPGPQGTFR
ncbi:hypothetical protein HY251_07775 [bacterium]|nr:hypothetical protein [bacterium]